MQFGPKAGVNLSSLTSKLLQGNKIANDEQNNIMINTPTGDIILNRQIKTHDGWITGDNFLHEANNERAASVSTLPKRNINNLHIELGHPSETITQAAAKALGIPHSKILRGKAFL